MQALLPPLRRKVAKIVVIAGTGDVFGANINVRGQSGSMSTGMNA
jgi:hypothetical protein